MHLFGDLNKDLDLLAFFLLTNEISVRNCSFFLDKEFSALLTIIKKAL
jgi:hypothetical protein